MLLASFCGIIAKLQGGSFRAGFFSGLSRALDIGTVGYGNIVSRTVIMAVVGGTASALGGGKFANGAMSGAYVHLFNAEIRFSWSASGGVGAGAKRFFNSL